MKRLLRIVLFLLCPIILNAQVELYPIYTSPHMGTGAKFSEDGSKIVTWGGFGFSVWDAKTGKVLYTVTGHKDIVNYAEFNHKGTALVTASDDNTAKVWDAKTGNLIRTLSGHKDWVCYAKFNATDDRIITKSEDDNSLLWDASTGKVLRKFSSEKKVGAINFSSNGSKFITTESNSIIGVYDARTGNALHELKVSAGYAVNVEFDKNDRRIIIMYENSIKIIDTLEFNLYKAKVNEEANSIRGDGITYVTQCFKMHDCYYVRTVYDKRNDIVVLRKSNDSIQVWDVNTGKVIREFCGEYYGVEGIMMSEDGKSIYLSMNYGALTCINSDSGFSECLVKSHKNEITFGGRNTFLDYCSKAGAILFVCDEVTWFVNLNAPYNLTVLNSYNMSGEKIGIEENIIHETFKAAVIKDSIFQIRSYYKPDVVLQLKKDEAFKGVSWNIKAGRIVTQTTDDINIYNVEKNKLCDKLSSDLLDVVAYNEESESIYQELGSIQYWNMLFDIDDRGENVLIWWNGIIYVWNTRYHTLRHVNNEPVIVSELCFDRSGKYICYLNNNRSILKIYNASSCELITTFGNNKEYFASAASDKMGRYIAITGLDSTVSVREIETGKVVTVVRDCKGSIQDAQFNIQGNRMVTAGNKGTANIWNVYTGELIATLLGSKSFLYKAYFSDDDQKIITHSYDGLTRIYDANQLPYSFTDIPEEEKQTDITLSPNPAQNEIRICFSEPLKEKGEYAILSPTGVQITKGEIPTQSNGFTYTIDNTLNSGTYICLLRINGEDREEKFVVMR